MKIMNKWVRNLGVGCMGIVIVLVVCLGIGNANSSADEENNYVDEMVQASEAFEEMNDRSQQQMMAGFHVANIDISSMDIETAMMMLQAERARILEEQMKEQMNEVREGQQRMAELQGKLAVARAELAEFRRAGNESLDEETKEKIEGLEMEIAQLEANVHTLSNTQQMDMLRLQSLSNKRNEAFDVMTNFVKRMQDSRTSIISNMR